MARTRTGVSATARAMESNIQRLARTMSQNWGINVVFNGLRPQTNGKTIFLPYNADKIKDQRMVHGDLDHEVAHVAEEVRHEKAGKTTPLTLMARAKTNAEKMLFNAFEDVRIERRYSAIYPGVAENIAYINAQSVEMFQKRHGKARGARNFWEEFGCAIIMEAHGLDTSWVPPTVAMFMPMIKDEIAAVRKANWAHEVMRLAESTYAKVIGLVKEARSLAPEPDDEGEAVEPEEDELVIHSGDKKRKEGEKAAKKGIHMDLEDGEKEPPTPEDGEDGEGEAEPAEGEESTGEGEGGDEDSDGEGGSDDSDGDDVDGEDGASGDDVDAGGPSGDPDGEGDGSGESGPDDAPAESYGDPDASGARGKGEGDGSDGQADGSDVDDKDFVRDLADALDALPESKPEEQPAGADLSDAVRDELAKDAATDMAKHRRYIPHPAFRALDRWITPCPTGSDAVRALNDYRDAVASLTTHTNTLRARLASMLRAMKVDRKAVDREHGRLDPSALHTLKTGNRLVFEEEIAGLSLNSAVQLVVDFSGSMGGRKRQPGVYHSRSDFAFLTCVMMAEALEKLGVPLEIIGYNNNNGRRAWVTDTCGMQTRSGFDYYIIKGFNERLRACRERFTYIDGYQDNADGEAVRECGKRLAARPELRKIQLVLTDGMPMAAGCGEGPLNSDLELAIAELRAVDIDVFGVGICSRHVKEFYGDNSIFINKPDDLPIGVFKAFRSCLMKGIGRRRNRRVA